MTRVPAAKVLGVRPGDPQDAIRAAWRDAARRHHPDRGGDPASFRAAADAYRQLARQPAAESWPPLADLPEGTIELELADATGVAWQCIASNGDDTIATQFFSFLEDGGWTSMMLADVQRAATEAGVWSPLVHSTPFHDAARVACRWALGSDWLVAEPVPPGGIDLQQWLWRVFCRSSDERDLRPDRSSALGVARALESFGSYCESGQWVTRDCDLRRGRLHRSSSRSPGGSRR